MRDEVANLVHPVITYGLRLKHRLDRGELPDLDGEQAALKGFLGSDTDSRNWPDFGGDPGADATKRGSEVFLGIRYGLACWLDEIFILDTPWESKWNERKLEVALYGTNDRAWKFWEQAKRAETRQGSDALEAYFLCVMLGFRGDLRDQPDKLKAWTTATQSRVAKSQGQEWPVPPEIDPPINVPPLRGREKMQRMLLIGALILLPLIFVFFFVVLQQLGS